jgi:hypothetical protein
MPRRKTTGALLIVLGALFLAPSILVAAWALQMSLVMLAPLFLATLLGAALAGVALVALGTAILRGRAALR